MLLRLLTFFILSFSLVRAAKQPDNTQQKSAAESADQSTASASPIKSNAHEIILNKPGAIEFYKSNKAFINALDGSGALPLPLAASMGKLDVVKALLEAGADVNGQNNSCPDSVGSTALHYAAMRGDDKMVLQLLKHGAVVNVRDVNLMTPLHDACKEGHLRVVEFLLAKKADVNLEDKHGNTALYYATNSKSINEKIVGLLVTHAASFKAAEDQPVTPPPADTTAEVPAPKPVSPEPADTAKKSPASSVPTSLSHRRILDDTSNANVTYFKDKSLINTFDYRGELPLLVVAQFGDVAMCSRLLDWGADVNAIGRTSDKMSALHNAAFFGYDLMVRKLLEHKADIEILDSAQNTPLMLAVAGNNHKACQILIDDKANVNAVNEQGFPILIKATQNINLGIMKLLLDNGALPNAPDAEGGTALHTASHAGCVQAIKLLLDKGAVVNSMNKKRYSPLLMACFSRDMASIKLLIERGALINCRGVEGFAPIHLVATTENVELAKLLLDHGADINDVDIEGDTPLHFAARRERPAMVKFLIEQGADPKRRNLKRKYPEDLATTKPVLSVFKFFNKQKKKLRSTVSSSPSKADKKSAATEPVNKKSEQNGLEFTHEFYMLHEDMALEYYQEHKQHINTPDSTGALPLPMAAYLGYERLVVKLLEWGANINAKHRIGKEDGSTALIGSIMRKHSTIVSHLLKHDGIDVNICDDLGNTPLHIACDANEAVNVKLLLDKGAKVNATNAGSTTPLLFALGRGFEGIARLLIENGADINLCDKNGHSPLHIAAQIGLEKLAEELLERKANIHAASKTGFTPLCTATFARKTIIAIMLLLRGAKPNIVTNVGTPLYFAACQSNMQLVHVLISKNADVCLGAKDGNTPLHGAVEKGYASMVGLLLEKGANPLQENKERKSPMDLAKKIKNENKHEISKLLKAAVWQKNDSAKIEAEKKAVAETTTASPEQPKETEVQKSPEDRVVEVLKLTDPETFYNQLASLLPTVGAELVSQKINEHKVDINKIVAANASPLYLAVDNGNAEMANVLIANGADINFVNRRTGNSLLHLAINCNQFKMATDLIGKGAKIAVTNKLGNTPLHAAVLNGSEKFVKHLIDLKSDINKQNRDGYSPLHYASANGSEAIVKLLLEHGADKDCMNAKDKTPVDCARENNKKNILAIFNPPLKVVVPEAEPVAPSITESAPASPKIELPTDKVVVEQSVKPKKPKRSRNSVVKALTAVVPDELPVIEKPNVVAAEPVKVAEPVNSPLSAQQPESVKVAEPAAEVKSAEPTPATPVIDETELLEELYEKIMTPTEGVPFKKTSELKLLRYAQKGNIKDAMLLLANNADPDVRGAHGNTPLHVAAYFGQIRMVGLLIDAGAQVKAREHRSFPEILGNTFGDTALHSAAAAGHVNVATLLMLAGADKHQRNRNGDTPFFVAIRVGHLEMVKFFISERASVNVNHCYSGGEWAPNKNGDSPLHIAVIFGHTAIVKFLLECGANRQFRNHYNLTPLDAAMMLDAHQNDRKEIIKLLQGYYPK